MLDWGPAKRTVYGARQALGLGAIAGAFEVTMLAARLKLDLGFGGLFGIGLASIAANMAFAGLIALGVGLPFHMLRREASTPNAVAGQLGVSGGLIAAWYLAQGAAQLVADGRAPAAALMSSMPFLAAIVVYFNARYWVRRAAREGAPPIGFDLVGLGAALLTACAAAGLGGPGSAGSEAYAEDGSVILVTVEGLADTSGSSALDALTAKGVRFSEAISPSSDATVAHAALLTGRHPLRNGFVRPGGRLAATQRTLAERLLAEGYATGAFVSGPGSRRSAGLGQGFSVYDDGVARGFDEVNLLAWVGAPLWPTARPGADTVRAALAWSNSRADRPQLLWVHLPAASAELIGADLAALIGGLEASGVAKGALWMVAGVPSASADAPHPVADKLVRGPLVIVWPEGPERVSVSASVRLFDLGPTALAWLGMAEPEEGEGADLRGFATGARDRALWSALIGENAKGGPVLGLRVGGVKYVLDLDSGVESLFDLATDPAEQADLAGAQAEALVSARAQLGPERVALRRAWGP